MHRAPSTVGERLIYTSPITGEKEEVLYVFSWASASPGSRLINVQKSNGKRITVDLDDVRIAV